MLAPRRSPSGRSCGPAPADPVRRPARAPAVSSADDPRLRRSSATLRLRRLPDRVAATRAIDAAEAFRDLPGPRPARERPPGPQRPLDLPDRRPGRGPRVAGRRTGPVRRRAPARRPPRPDTARARPTRRRSSAGSSASSATTWAPSSSGCRPSPRPTRTCRRCGSRSTTGSSPGTGGPGHAWLGGRALDGDGRRLARRLDDVHARLTTPRPAAGRRRTTRRPAARSSSARVSTGRAYEAGVERIRDHIAAGDIYQANLTRRLETRVRRRSVGPLPPPADGRSVAVLGLPRPRCRAAERPAAGPAVRVARAVPVGRLPRASS